VNVTVETLAPCKKLLRIEVDAQAVDTAFAETTAGFQREARLPGFRPGKAPREMITRTYAKEIEKEVKKKLMSDAYRRALEEQKIRVIGYPDIEEITFGRGQALQFAATVETAPEFELPEYKGLPVKIEARTVTEADMERALDVLRTQRATYNDVARPVQTGDFVVVNYTGTCDGKPITETAPTATGLTTQKDFWVHVEKDSFIPGFSEQLIGANAGDKRTVSVDFPAEFVTPQLAGKKGIYEV
jgi:trigger factor